MDSKIYYSNSSSSSTSSTTSSCLMSDQERIISTPKRFVFILNAFVNGFAQLKLSADQIDFEYIIEIYWSNDTRSFVKRTYDDFVIFHRNLTNKFSQNITESKYMSNKSLNDSKANHICSLPFLPTVKKRFWISNVKLAELREVELNTYVQQLLKLPTKITHSEIVLEFFESHTGDPKPTNVLLSIRLNNNNNDNCLEFGSESFYDEVKNFNKDFIENYLNQSRCNNARNQHINTQENLSDLEDDADIEYDNEEDSKKLANKQAGLWWDEDNALNELTTSSSFEYGSHYNLNQNQFGNLFNHTNQSGNSNQDLETLSTLESILKNSDLFSNNSRNDYLASSSSFSSLKFRNKQHLNVDLSKRLSLS